MHCQDINLTEGNNRWVFGVQNVPGDGNCFFHCLSLSMHDNFSMSDNYRNDICGYILRNWEFFSDNIELEQYSSLSYFNSMILGKEYASSCEIEVASKLFCREINVWLECINQNGYISYVRLNFKPDNLIHYYQFLIPKFYYQTQEVETQTDKHNKSPVLWGNVYFKDSKCHNLFYATKQKDVENLNTHESALAKDHKFSRACPYNQTAV